MIATGLHRNHIDPDFNLSLGTGNGLMCAECHAKTVGFANNTTITDKTMHVNKFKDYSGVYARGTANYDHTNQRCSNLYCHSNGKPGTPVHQYRNPAAWIRDVRQQCNGCHGSRPRPLGAPSYANTGAAGSNTSNSHQLHMQKLAIADSTGCYTCHSRTSRQVRRPANSAPTQRMHHQRRARTSGLPASARRGRQRYNPGANNMTCTTVVCHSNGKGGYQDAQWGATTNCALCHALNKLSRGHIFHIYTTATNNPTFYNNYTANRSDGLPRRRSGTTTAAPSAIRSTTRTT